MKMRIKIYYNDTKVHVAAAVMRTLYRTIVVKRELSIKGKLLLPGPSTFPPSPMVTSFR